MQPKEVVDVALYLSEWSKCLTSKYQRDQLYRLGELDDCSRQWNDFGNAVNAKFVNDTKEAEKIVQKTYYHQRTNVSPTIGVIWEAKETPGWY
jgi:uridine kinase